MRRGGLGGPGGTKSKKDSPTEVIYDDLLRIQLRRGFGKLKVPLAGELGGPKAPKLLKEWVKDKHKAKQKEHAFKKFVEDNRVLIEGGFGNIILKYDESWNSTAGDWNRNVSIDISSSSQVEERIEEEIIFQQIESETLDELEVNVREAIINKSQRLLT